MLYRVPPCFCCFFYHHWILTSSFFWLLHLCQSYHCGRLFQVLGALHILGTLQMFTPFQVLGALHILGTLQLFGPFQVLGALHILGTLQMFKLFQVFGTLQKLGTLQWSLSTEKANSATPRRRSRSISSAKCKRNEKQCAFVHFTKRGVTETYSSTIHSSGTSLCLGYAWVTKR